MLAGLRGKIRSSGDDLVCWGMHGGGMEEYVLLGIGMQFCVLFCCTLLYSILQISIIQ